MKQLLQFLLFLFLGTAVASAQQERITSFHSDVVINLDGSLDVTETISVYAKGDKIKRGIEISIPSTRVDSTGRKFDMRMEIVEVLRDGEEEMYNLRRERGDLIVRIGKASFFLPTGEYTYTIKYKADWQIGYYENYDELYWNIAGHESIFPIEEASATIVLPEGVRFIQSRCHTGAYGNEESACSSNAKGQKIYVQSNRKLKPREGISIAVGFTSGVVERPPYVNYEQVEPPKMDERETSKWALPVSIAGVMGLLGFFFFTWRQFGVDPPKPTVIPRFRSPNEMTPAQLRYIQKRFVDKRAFTAAIVNLAVKGAITIDKTGEAAANLDKVIPGKLGKVLQNAITTQKTYLVKNAGFNASSLKAEESVLYDKLFRGKKKVELDKDNYTTLSAAYSIFKSSVKKKVGKGVFVKHNMGLLLLGILLSAAILITTLLLLRFPLTLAESDGVRVVLVILYFLLQVGLLVVIAIFFPAYKRGKGKISTDGCGKVFGKMLFFAWAGVFFFGFASTIFGAIYSMVHNINFAGIGKYGWLIMALLLTLIVANIAYFYFIKKPSAKALENWSAIEGFDMYLRTAEEKRLNMLNAPEKTPELFEKLLPYAIALNAEVEWGDKFSAIVEKALAEGSYDPVWYNGHGNFNAGNFTRDVYSDVSGPVNSGMTPPSSSGSGGGGWSGGSGGGGFSGGGGGGSSVGGW